MVRRANSEETRAEDELLERFARADFAPGTFRHRDHVHVAWALLLRFDTLEALRRMDEGIRALAEASGSPGLYHRTVTWAYVLLIAERLERQGRAGTFDAFLSRNGDLLDWRGAGLRGLYHEETLASPLAKRAFLLPDRLSARG